ncbi:MAG: hypothetical protein ACYS0G_10695 [Planctomycetota bacterium]
MSDERITSDDTTARQGLVVDGSDPRRLHLALELALDYRGDVTITRRSSGELIEGYVFDRVPGPTAGEAKVRIMVAHGDARITIPCHDIAEVRFSGRDTAAGKSFETWMKKYVEKKLAGEGANLEPEPLDDCD